MLEALDGQGARAWARRALVALGHAREEIDALNVFPVPDGDTGTNLYLTFEAAVAAARDLPPDCSLGALCDGFARGALLGARGNSGVILSQLLRGWADVLGEAGTAGPDDVRAALVRANEQAWAAVARPVEGTILSVAKAAAEAAGNAAGGSPEAAAAGLVAVVRAAALGAREALERTPTQLETLRRAGVVDAGGRGLVVLLDSLQRAVEGTSEPPADPRAPLPVVDRAACGDLDEAGPGYEVMYLLDTSGSPEAEPDRVAELRESLDALGDSLVVVGGHGLWNVHVHTDDPGAAVEAALEAGRPYRVRITHFADQLRRSTTGHHVDRPGRPSAETGLVACAAGPGLRATFEAAGAVVVASGPGRRASTGEILRAITETQADAVVVLPNDTDTVAVAQAASGAARERGLRVVVVPTRAQVQGLAAAAVHDPERALDDDAVRMSAAAGATRHGAVTIAVRDAMTSGGPCRVGDPLGVIDGDIVIVGEDLPAVAAEVVRRLLSGGGELLTLVTGQGSDSGLVAAVQAVVREARWDVETQVLDGGQPRYPLLVGVE